jgi:predicted nucleotidyltransferase
MKQIKKMTQAEIAAYVQSHLRKKGITVILSGGATVSIYTSNKYVSADVDLINVQFADRKKIKEAMMEIGFHEKNRFFTHPDTKHIASFRGGYFP